jgi:hypothetical protein
MNAGSRTSKFKSDVETVGNRDTETPAKIKEEEEEDGMPLENKTNNEIVHRRKITSQGSFPLLLWKSVYVQ